MRRTPAASSSATGGSWLPLVVSVSSSSAPVEMARQGAEQPHDVRAPKARRRSAAASARRGDKGRASRSSSSSVSMSFLGRNDMSSAMQ